MSEEKDDLEWVITTQLDNKERYYTGAYESKGTGLVPQFKENYNLALKCQTQGQANRIKEAMLLVSAFLLPTNLEVKGMLPAIPKINKVTTLDTVVFEALGEASMCWSEQPTGEFDNVAINIVADKLIANICKVTGYKI